MKRKFNITSFFVIAMASLSCSHVGNNSSVKVDGGSLVTKSPSGGSAEDTAINLQILKTVVTFTHGVNTCSAFLINTSYAVTAAHCVDLNAKYAYISFYMAKDANGFPTYITVPTKSIVIHQDHQIKDKNRPENDIALIPLGKDAPSFYQPVKTIQNGEPLPLNMIAAGYAPVVHGASAFAQTSDIHKTPIISQIEVLDALNEFRLIHLSSGACPGDSGGPAFGVSGADLTLVGLNFRANCGDVTDPDTNGHVGYYTTVSLDLRKYQDWLQKGMDARVRQ
jgi:secreted trypsin-like serine protease